MKTKYDKNILDSISTYFNGSKELIAVAESVTSGHLQVALSLTENATQFFQGGITAYNLMQKYKHLHIKLSKAITCNCVSKTIAEDMAQNVSKLFSSQWGVGITGYASPIPDEGIFHLHAYYAFSYQNQIIDSGSLTAPEINMEEVQLFYTNEVLKKLSGIMKTREIKSMD